MTPKVQGVHTVLAEALHESLLYVPAEHIKHGDGAVTPATQKLLTGHAIWEVVLGQENPAGHAMHVVFANTVHTPV